MVKESLVKALAFLFSKLAEDKVLQVSKAALAPAYEGAVPGLYTLIVAIEDSKMCADKIECLIYGLHDYVAQDDRRAITAVRVFDTKAEFDYYTQTGYGFDSCEPCARNIQPNYNELKPEILDVQEYV